MYIFLIIAGIIIDTVTNKFIGYDFNLTEGIGYFIIALIILDVILGYASSFIDTYKQNK